MHPGLASPLLSPAWPWLYAHSEYEANEYITARLAADEDLVTDDITAADLCYPTCNKGTIRILTQQWKIIVTLVLLIH